MAAVSGGDVAQSLTGEAVVAHRAYTETMWDAAEVPAQVTKRTSSPGCRNGSMGRWLPDLTSTGYNLVGGRLLPTGEGAAAHFMYENEIGDRLTLYVRTNRTGGETAFRFDQDRQISAFYWLDGPLAYALLAEADQGCPPTACSGGL